MSKEKYNRKRRRTQERAQKKSAQAKIPDEVPVTGEHEGKASQQCNPDGSEKEGGRMRFREFFQRSSFTDWCLTAFTFVLAAVSIWQGVLLNRQLGDSEDQFSVANRPWLSVEVEPGGDLIFVNGQASMNLKVSISNIGKSIAKNTQIDVKFAPSTPGMMVSLDAPRIQHELCDNAKSQGVGTFDVFPTDKPIERQMSVSTTKANLDATALGSAADPTQRFVGLYIVGCVSYRSTFEQRAHQTRFAYHLAGPAGLGGTQPVTLSNGMFAMVDFAVGKQIPQKEIAMWQEVFGSNEAY